MPKRNFVKENVKRVQELSRRSTPTGDATSMTFKPTQTSLNSARRSINSRTSAKNTITVIKAAPIDFPKSMSDESLASSTISTTQVERPPVVPSTATSETGTREVSIQTADPSDDGFMQNVIIRHPSASVLDKLAENLRAMELKHVAEQRRRKRHYFGLDYCADSEAELAGSDEVPHDVKRMNQLAKLEEYSRTNAVKVHKDKKPFDEMQLTALEVEMIDRMHKNNALRSKQQHMARLLKEAQVRLLVAAVV